MTDMYRIPFPDEPTYLAPDGSEVRLLCAAAGAGTAHFRLPAGRTSAAVVHRTVDEIWFVVSGAGEMWRHDGTTKDVCDLVPGLSLTIPCGVRFQFRSTGDSPLDILGVTTPPWPGEEEAQLTDGPW